MGIIYVLINEAMPGLVKVGKITLEGKTVEDRMKELDTTGVPMPFECFAAWEFEDVEGAESALHNAFDDHRLRKRREFFRMSPDKPTAILKAFGTKEMTPSGDVVVEDDDRQALDRERCRRQNFNFSLIGITPGASLQSVFNSDVVCTVVDDKKVSLGDDPISLSAAALQVARDNGYGWKTINGPAYWKYEGRTLSELRDSLGEGES